MDASESFNLEAALARLDGDRELFADLVAVFLEESPKQFAAALAALARQDSAGVAATAHKLKGSVMQFCAQPLLDSVKRLEGLGREGDLADAASLCATVEIQLAELQNALRGVNSSDRAS